MYITNGQFLGITQAENEDTSPMYCTVYYNAFTSAGLTMPQLNQTEFTDATNEVEILSEPPAGTTYQPTYITVYNQDIVDHVTRIWLDMSGSQWTQINILIPAGNTLEWSRETGWKLAIGEAQSSVTFSVFTSNGTWTKPVGLKRAIIAAVGGGGGAGSGRQGAAGENRFGGGGGGGAAFVLLSIASDALTDTVAVTVGAGGTGGAGQASTSSNGIAGTVGGDTSFGGILVAKGGLAGGAGGTTAGTAGTGGAANQCNPAFGPFALNGAAGSAGTSNTTSTAGPAGFVGNTACPGGAGGAGINSANTSATNAGSGGAIYENGISQAGPTAGASPDGVNDKSRFLHLSTTLTSGTGIGTGGAGGYPAFVNGGNGGRGAGGGGGSGTLNGTTSGAGGNGGDGFVVVMEIY